MAKQYKANATTFTPIAETSGIIYNAGATDVELVSDTNAQEGQGMLLRSGTAQSFYGTILARSKDFDDEAVLNVVDFSPAVSGGGSSGSSTKGGSSVQSYASKTAYKANDLLTYGTNLYLVVKDYTSDTIETDVKAGSIVQVNAGGGVQTYTAGTSYKANDLVSNGGELYLVMKDYTAAVVADDVTAGNLNLINSSSVKTTDTDAFMTTAEVDALFA